MKYLLILGLTVAVIWLWQSKRRSTLTDKTKQPSAKPQPKGRSRKLPVTEIVACDVCGVHLPQAEAVVSVRGAYCSDAHRSQAES